MLPKRAYIVHRKYLPSMEQNYIDKMTMKQKDWSFF